MTLRGSTIATIFRAEMLMLLRDKRIVVTAILIPLFLTPLMFLGSTWSIKHREKTLREMTYHYAVTGDGAEVVRSLASTTRERLAKANEKPHADKLRFEEQQTSAPLEALKKGDLQLVLEGILTGKTNSGAQSMGAASPKPTGRKGADEESEEKVPGAPVVRIIFRADRDDSATASSRMQAALNQTRLWQREALLKSHNFPIKPVELATIAESDLASKQQVAGLALGRTITLLLLIFILTGGAVVATDSLAGEKERGTLETLLTSSASRLEILASKQLVIVAVALMITCIQTCNLLIYVSFKLLPLPMNLSAAVPPRIALLLFLLFLPITALVANVLLLISGRARTYKEAQMYFLPVMMLGLLPAIAPMLPGLTLRSAIVLLPVANIALAAKEILTGVFDWPMVVLAWLVTAGTAAWTTRLGVRVLSAEKLITAADSDSADFAGGPLLFERHVARWFALLWALLVLVSNYMGKVDLRFQVLINLVVLFFGASLLMMWRYHLSPKKALALRAPKLAVWLGVLVAAPGGLLTGFLCFRLSNLLLPVSTRTIESFSEMVMPPGISLFQLLFFLAVMPAVFEETAFRGLLLHGLRRRLHPAALAIVVGLTFGFFHVALFRFVPTAALGIMLAAVTMLTGSIFPAMLWHFLHNASGLLVSDLGFSETDLEPVAYICGLGLLAVGFWIFWRHRTPYPELRKWSGKQ